MPSDILWQRLCEYMGLSEYEAKVYVSLIETGAAKARRLGIMCGVPRTKVYGALKKLIDIGLVVEVPEEPKEYVPTPPKTAFEAYLRSYQKKAKSFVLVVSSLEHQFEKATVGNKPQKITVWVLSGRQEILRKIREILYKARKSVDIITNENGLVLLYKAYNRLFDELADRSIEVHISTPMNSSNQHPADELRYLCKIELVNFLLPFIFLGVDGNQFLLANLRPDDFSLSSEHDKGVFFDDDTLYEIIRSLIYEKVNISLFHSSSKETSLSAVK